MQVTGGAPKKWAMQSQDWQAARRFLMALGCTAQKPDPKEQHLRRAEPLFALGVNCSHWPNSAFLLT